MSCFYSQGYCLCCLFAADGEAGEVVEVDDTEVAVAVDDGISSVDGDMDALACKVKPCSLPLMASRPNLECPWLA